MKRLEHIRQAGVNVEDLTELLLQGRAPWDALPIETNVQNWPSPMSSRQAAQARERGNLLVRGVLGVAAPHNRPTTVLHLCESEVYLDEASFPRKLLSPFMGLLVDVELTDRNEIVYGDTRELAAIRAMEAPLSDFSRSAGVIRGEVVHVENSEAAGGALTVRSFDTPRSHRFEPTIRADYSNVALREVTSVDDASVYALQVGDLVARRFFTDVDEVTRRPQTVYADVIHTYETFLLA